MRITEILEHFLTRSTWVDPEKTVDRFIAGKPDKVVDRCLVSWIPNMRALRYAAENGYELVICHEPTFWNHFDDIPETSPRTTDKLHFIEKNGLTILRNHDTSEEPGMVTLTEYIQQNLGIQAAHFPHGSTFQLIG